MALSFTLLALSACGDNNPAALVQNQHNVVSTASGMQPTTTLPVLAATAGQVLSATAASGAATTPVASTTHQDVALSLTPGLPAPALTLNPAPASSPLPINRVLQTVADIPLPGNSSRFDYQSLDPKTGRLFIAHLGDSRLVVFDTRSNQVVSTIENLGGIHGVLVVPELGRCARKGS
ncbi:MAG TPA: hypothetical protein VH186_34915 [Chloroflexia bacterium]|nr:hypothetical protein [Chloroflexia bacterium]